MLLLFQVEYECYSGYIISGSKVLTCSASGIWNGIPPKCIAVGQFSKGAFIIYGRGWGVGGGELEGGGGQTFHDLLSWGGGNFILAYIFGGAIFFLTHYFVNFFFAKVTLHVL